MRLYFFSFEFHLNLLCSTHKEESAADSASQIVLISLSQAFIDNQTLVGMKVMSKDPGKVWRI